jgi:hypothetical protein
MKKRNPIAFVVSVAVLMGACIPSVNPFYTEKDVVLDPRLIGDWQEKGDTNNPENWSFEQSTNNTMKLTVVEQGKTGAFAAHLFKLGQEQFLDLIPTDCEYATNQADLVAFSMFPGHLLAHVPQIEPELTVAFCDFDWFEKYLEQNPRALAHHREGERIVLTAETRDLQRFVLKHLGTNELFKESAQMVRRRTSSKNGAR